MLVKLQVSPLQLEVNAALGGWFAGLTVTVFETEFDPPPSVTMRVTL